MIVRFVDKDGIKDHQCLNFIFIQNIIVQRQNLKRRLFKEINAPTEHTPGKALK